MPEDNSLTVTRKTCIVCKKDFFTSVGACPTCGDTNLVEVKRDAFIGRTLANRYQVESLIGTGGMGVVYKAWQETLKRSVAVKILRQQFVNDETSVRRFQQEAIAASRLAHPNIVTLHDFGTTEDGYLYMVMDIINGRSLAQEVRDKKTIGVDRTIRIVSQVCDALEHAHHSGIVHRDLKPGNIMLVDLHDGTEHVKLVDFGIAKVLKSEEDQELTQKGEVFGSPLYMSPEQCLGQDLDGRSDIYSLGTVLYESLTGLVPHKGRTIIETIDKQIHAEPPSFSLIRPDLYIPERLEAVVMKSLSKNPSARQQSMKELAAELQASVPRKAEALNLRSRIEPAQSQASPKIGKRVAAAIALLSLVVGGTVWSIKEMTSRQSPQTVQQQNPHNQTPPGTLQSDSNQASKTVMTGIGDTAGTRAITGDGATIGTTGTTAPHTGTVPSAATSRSITTVNGTANTDETAITHSTISGTKHNLLPPSRGNSHQDHNNINSPIATTVRQHHNEVGPKAGGLHRNVSHPKSGAVIAHADPKWAKLSRALPKSGPAKPAVLSKFKQKAETTKWSKLQIQLPASD